MQLRRMLLSVLTVHMSALMSSDVLDVIVCGHYKGHRSFTVARVHNYNAIPDCAFCLLRSVACGRLIKQAFDKKTGTKQNSHIRDLF